jgi:hypothetical protein
MSAAQRISSRPFVVTLIVVAITASSLVAGVNWWVDPFQHYREATRYPARFFNAHQRHINPGLVKHADYNRIIMGSSLMENVDSSEVDRLFAATGSTGRSINLSLSAMTAFDANQLLTLAAAVGRVKHVIINLDYNAFSGAPTRSGFGAGFPSYLYDQIAVNDLPYLLALDTSHKSMAILRNQQGAARYSENRANPWFWADGTEFSAAKATRNLDANHLNKQFVQPNRKLTEMRASFDKNILPLIAENPEIKFSFVFLPYSILVWADFQQRNQVEVTLQFRDYAFTATKVYRNVEWFDFQAAPQYVNDLSHYTDIYHFSPSVSREIFQSIADNKYRLDAATLTKNNWWLRETARNAKPTEIIRAARQ